MVRDLFLELFFKQESELVVESHVSCLGLRDYRTRIDENYAGWGRTTLQSCCEAPRLRELHLHHGFETGRQEHCDTELKV